MPPSDLHLKHFSLLPNIHLSSCIAMWSFVTPLIHYLTARKFVLLKEWRSAMCLITWVTSTHWFRVPSIWRARNEMETPWNCRPRMVSNSFFRRCCRYVPIQKSMKESKIQEAYPLEMISVAFLFSLSFCSSGSSVAVMMVLALACAVCLIGTALLLAKKSTGRSARYIRLTSAESPIAQWACEVTKQKWYWTQNTTEFAKKKGYSYSN